ncbi:homoserine dehydrogenase [Tepidamorphus gemmatus]|uniref:Homoserine dehydrogenase n=1 Tax=Tepidamorphus gemmatus TaxID=747076 RepID=A0A4R3MD31_9HYPH|nr:homoserine dehydrogenase [Tepidamorphus gemmatus]TCT11451.1 homoserine dehydrogenase [Tepidamorphus gemmatus]
MSQALRVGLAGLGTVGGAVFRLLSEKAGMLAARAGRPIAVTAVCARDRMRDRGLDLGTVTWYGDPVAMARDADIDIFVEVMGGGDGPAAAAVEAALAAGRSVVTANKALLATRGVALARLAEASGATIGYEAAVAGGIPIIKTLREAVVGNRVSRVYGILNGTCNYILTRMEEGLSFQECLADAQRLGYAEADPTFDIEGHDSAHKLAILAALAFGTEIDTASIHLEGISSITPADLSAAEELGYRIKLLGVARRTESGIEQRVTPTMVPLVSAMAGIHGVLNAVAVDGDEVGEIMLVGPGAGGTATASAVVGDIVDIARGGPRPATFGQPAQTLTPYRAARMRAHEGGYYIRLSVFDRPGAFAAIARRMAEQSISLESIMQKDGHDRDGSDVRARRVILITHETTEAQIRRALDAIQEDGQIEGRPQMIRIEKP